MKIKRSVMGIVSLVIALGFISSVSFSEEKPKKQLTFGLSIRDAAPSAMRIHIVAAQEKAKELGVKLIVLDSHNDALKQIDQLENLIGMGIDGLILAGSIDKSAITPGLEAVNKANIPIVAIDDPPISGKIELFLGIDSIQLARRSGEVLIDLLKRKYGKVPEGVVVGILGALKDRYCQEGMEGFYEVIDKYPQLKVKEGEGNYMPDDAFRVTSDLMSRWGKEVIAVWILADLMAPGVIPAIEQAGYDPRDLVVVTEDYSPDGEQFTKECKITANISVTYYDQNAKLAVQYLYDLCCGKEIPKPGDVVVFGKDLSVRVTPTRPGEVCPRLTLPYLSVPWEIGYDDPSLLPNIIHEYEGR